MRTRGLVLCVVYVAALLHTGHAAFTEVQDFEATGSKDYGYDIDGDGDFAIIGARGHTGTQTQQGAVEFWQRVDGVWTGLGYTFSPTPEADGFFGWGVAMSGSYSAVGALLEGSNVGKVYISKYSGTAWEPSRTLTMTNPSSGDNYFGNRLALENDRLVVGATNRGGSDGAFRIFERDGNDDWTEVLAVDSTLNQELGDEVAIDGDYASIGAFAYNGANTRQGRVYVYKRSSSGTWGSTPHQTIDHPSPANDDYFGRGLSAAGGYLVVGAYGEDDGGAIRGSVYFYELNTGTDEYELKTTYQEPSSSPTGNVGLSVSVGADGVALISDWRYSLPSNKQGRAVVFKRNAADGTWSKGEALQGSTSKEDSYQGHAVFYKDGVAIVGAYQHNDYKGAAWFFEDPELGESGGNASEVHSQNPLRCGEYDETEQRYFYDDGTGCEDPPTVNDACYYSAGDLVTTDPTTLRADLSELKADEGEDYIYLAFDLADKYYNNELVFADAAEGACAHGDWEQVSATRNVTDLDACYTTFVYRLPWSDAYNVTGSKCGWQRDGSGANVKLVLDFAVRADEDLSARRNGSTITREMELSMPVEVQFPTQVTASPVNVTVFAPVRVLAAVTSQSVTIDEAAVEATLTLELFTEKQKPFELFGIVESTDTMPTGVALETTMSGTEDEAVRQDDECTDGSADCANTWRWQYSTPSVSGGSNPCDFDGTYQVTFGVRCSDVAETDCPIDGSTDSVEITLTVSTSNHCPSVIDSVDLNAALAVYDLPARADAQDDFVGDGVEDDGQTADLDDWQVAYFAAPVTSKQVAIQRTEFNRVWIVRHQETVSEADDDVVVLLDADDSIDVSPYDSVGEIDCGVVAGVGGADATATAVSAASGCSPAKDGVGGTYSFNFKHGEGGNSEAGEASTPIFEFDVRTDAAGFNMANDAIETMQVNAVIDVEYANAAKRTGGAVQNNAQQSTVTSSFSMRTTGSTASSSGSTALFGVNATVLYGAGAFLVVAVLAVLVVVSRRRSEKAGKIERVESTAERTTTTAV